MYMSLNNSVEAYQKDEMYIFFTINIIIISHGIHEKNGTNICRLLCYHF